MPEVTGTATAMARGWIEAWNRRDLDAIMKHYAEDVSFWSPYIVERLGEPSGMLRGKDALRAYFARGLDAFPELRFELLDVLEGANSVAVTYRRENGMLACEVMTLAADGTVTSGRAHYSPDPVLDPLVAELATLPDRVEQLLAGRSEDEVRRRPADGEWSAKEIVGHLADAARIYHERLAATVSQERPLLPAYDEAALATQKRYQDANLMHAVEEIRRHRTATVSLLAPLPRAAWSRTAIHEENGEMSLTRLAAHMVDHEAEHVRDVAALLGGDGRERRATPSG